MAFMAKALIKPYLQTRRKFTGYGFFYTKFFGWIPSKLHESHKIGQPKIMLFLKNNTLFTPLNILRKDLLLWQEAYFIGKASAHFEQDAG